MEPKRILFYLEPITYANSPLRLAGWWNFFSAFARQSKGCFISQIAASPAICGLESDAFALAHPLNQAKLLESSAFHRAAYSQDLCRGLGYRNRPLLDALKAIKKSFAPDIVVSATDNRYLKKVFGRGNVMFMELGPLPRTGMKCSIYVDPFGHQIGSALDLFAKSRWEHPSLGEFGEIWRDRWLEPIREASAQSGIAAWLDTVPKRNKIRLVALQPSDWITYEGIGEMADPVSVLRKVAHESGEEWTIIPQWHPSDAPPSEALMEELTLAHPNILTPSPQHRVAQSELIIPHANSIAAVSSNVLATGAIMGKELKTIYNSKFKKYVYGESNNQYRLDLLAFISSKYCRPLDNFLNFEGEFATHISRLWRNPRWLFDERDLNSAHLQAFL